MNTLLKNRNKLFLVLSMFIVVVIIMSACDRDAIYDNIKNFSEKEVIYPAAFDTIYGRIGYERVEIDLRKDGRIPASKITMGKAQKTVVTYDNDTSSPVEIEIDSICSYVNVSGLTEPRSYRFLIYTKDQYGNLSTPQEISLTPYTSYDRDILAQGILDPSASIASSALLLEWPTGLNTIMMEYHGMNYHYTDADNEVNSGNLMYSPRIYASNLPSGEEVIFDMTYRVLPIVEGVELLDTISVEKPLVIQMPTPDQPFVPTESSILRANGINTFTLEEADKVEELVYPMNMTTFADLFFFNNVHTLDLTGKGLPGTLETLDYAKNNVVSRVGGGAWQEFMLPVDDAGKINANSGYAPESLQTLKDAIESEQIRKILYIPKTMGTAFDTFLQPYVDSGVVELIYKDNAHLPNAVFIEPQFFVNGMIETTAWEMNLYYSGNFLPRTGYSDIRKFDAKNNTVNGQTVDLKLDQLIQSDGSNIYRGVIVQKNATFLFAFPRQWKLNAEYYRYLKFKVFIGSDPSIMTGAHDKYRQTRLRIMNHCWGWGALSDYGQEQYDAATTARIGDENIQTQWVEYTIDLYNSISRHTREIHFNPGYEGGDDPTYNANREIVIYYADIRLCKSEND